jgi:Spy/CpxP family protein refolding chaperone
LSPKHFIAAAALAASVSLPLAAIAQTPAAAPPAAAHQRSHHHGHFMHALHTLGLSEAQKQQITSHAKEMRQANQNADPQTRRANMQQFRAQVDGVLTPSQRTQFQTELRNERKNAMPRPAASSAPHA